jgi:hypothetical protein
MKALHADHREMIILWAFARFDLPAFVAASAVVAGVALLSLTVALIIKGAPPGVPVGPHLAQLAVVFPGYSVSVGGAVIGAAYAGVVGGALGLILAAFWNAVHS